MSRIHACTIVAHNYLAYARVLCRSLLSFHPDARVFVLLVDRPHPAVDLRGEAFEAVYVDDLGIPGFGSLAFRSSLLELSTAVKPFLLARLFRDAGCERLYYFDPDIQILSRLDELEARLSGADAVLTPHLLAPLDDDRIPSERDILLSGVYNLGFVGLSWTGRMPAFLAWWQRRLWQDCRHQVERGLFVDQRWMDFAPSFLRTEILHHAGCNVAYWNLAHRRVEPGADGGWRVRVAGAEPVPLLFAHFSGIDARWPEAVSRYQNRFTLDSRPDLAPLFRRYAELLLAAGHLELAGVPCAFTRFADGTAIPAAARQALWLVDPQGRRWADPFAVGPGSFFEWLRQPVAGHPGLPRLAWLVWDQRPDLQVVFPHPAGEHRAGFAEWWLTSAVREGVPAALVTPDGRPVPVAPAGIEERLAARLAESEAGGGGEAMGGPSVPSWEGLSAAEKAWLAADLSGAEGEAHIPRLALQLHARRSDLQRAFPEPLGDSRAAFARWILVDGRLEYGLPEWVLAPVRRSLRWERRLRAEVAWRRRRRKSEEARARGGGAAAPAARGGRSAGGARTRPPGPLAPAPAGSDSCAAVLIQAPRPTPDERLPPPGGPLGAEIAAGKDVVTGDPVAAPGTEVLGVNVIGWIRAPTGVGEVCRGTLAALGEAGVPHAVWPLSERSEVEARAVGEDAGDAGLPYDLSLYHVNADMMETVWRWLPRGAEMGRFRVGYWFWELSHFPIGLAEAFRRVDEVWAASRFCETAFRVLAPVPVRWVPPCVPAPAADVSPAAVAATRAQHGIPPEAFLFYFAFDALSVPERKNPEGLLAAFGRAVRESPVPLHLLLKVRAAEAELGERLERLAAGLPVTLLHGTLSRPTLGALTAACDAYVSLHRSEGLGLPLIEALHLGKPVVATGYGGVTDFLDGETGWPVRSAPAALERPAGPYPRGAVWAEPDVAHAAACLVEVAADPAAAAARAAAGRERVRGIYGTAAAAARLRGELERIGLQTLAR